MISGVSALVFYDDIRFSVIGIAFVYPVIKIYKRDIVRKRKMRILTEFRYGLNFLATGVLAGLSVEKALVESYRNLRELFGQEALMTREMSYMINRISINEPVEKVVKDFAGRTGIREIGEFADVFEIGKRSGANMSKIMKSTSDIIMEKIQLKEEILTMTSSKRFEAQIMKIMPFAIILYMRWGTDNYFEKLYHNLAGNIVMSIAVIGFLLSCLWLDKIVENASETI